MLGAEDHGAGVAALALLTVDVEPHVEVLHVLDLVLGDEPRPDRPEGLAAFALVPLAAGALDLEGALGDVVRHEIAGDGVLRLGAVEIARALADDDAELDLVVELGRFARRDGIVVRPADAGDRLVEDDRLLRDRHAGFRGVVGIVELDGDEIAHLADAGAEPRLAADGFEALEVGLLDLGEADFGLDGLSGGRSPDRLDALVWAVTELTRRSGWEGPRIRGFGDPGPGPSILGPRYWSGRLVPRGILRPSYKQDRG